MPGVAAREDGVTSPTLPTPARTMDILDRLDLRGITGPTATLAPTGRGWAFTDGGRVYSLTEDREAPRGGVRGILEARTSGRYWIAWGDFAVAICRAEVATGLAGKDRDLEAAIRRDLWRFAYAARFARLDVVLLDGLVQNPEVPPEDHDELADVFIRGLPARAIPTVARLVRRRGGRVYRRPA